MIPAFIFHSVFILLINLWSHTVDFQFVFNLLIGNNTAKNINQLNVYIGPFLIYMLLNIAVNFVAAYFFRGYVLKTRLYKKYPFLGIYNKWYYILKPLASEEEKISVWLDILVETKHESIIYRGFLTDFWLDKDGSIKELHMEDVRRRVLAKDTQEFETTLQEIVQTTDVAGIADNDTRQTDEEFVFQPKSAAMVDERYYYIPGELFIIKYDDVKNMNITYFEEQIYTIPLIEQENKG
ncbi:hypothetical protein [Mucilaginibacter psychrotolerans]|uniref:hypothetical protein n=1 Tax=Mucilaginibacter psychrotolerans TaxID=1524096 RepID=UPI001057C747|nr:hypothetical protein [Mucilaginibacter psychrotolerans]